MGAMQSPSASAQHAPFSQVKVGGQMSLLGPQPTGGGMQRLSRSTQHWPFSQVASDGQAAPVPQPGVVSGTHVPILQTEPVGHSICEQSTATQPTAGSVQTALTGQGGHAIGAHAPLAHA